MTKTHRIFLTLTLLLAAAIAAGCSSRSAEPQAPDTAGEGEMHVALSVDMTRAPSSGSYNPGSELENHIDISSGDFRFLFYTLEGKFIDWLSVKTFTLDSEDADKRTYRLLGTVDEKLASLTDFKLVMLANWKYYPSPEKGDDISMLWTGTGSMVYDFTEYPAGLIDASHLIPLYAVREFTGMAFAAHQTLELGTLRALRALAKIEVRFDTARMYNTVVGVSLTHVNRYGYKLPAGCTLEGDYLHGDYAQDYTRSPHIPAPNQMLGEVPLTRQEDGSYVIYVPEYDNTSAASAKSRIKITYRETVPDASGHGYVPLTDYVDFKYYQKPVLLPDVQEGQPFDLMRNNWYRYVIGQNQRLLDVQVEVVPYSVITLQPGFGWDWLPEGDPDDKKDPDLNK